jgi:pyruvate,water dikinase
VKYIVQSGSVRELGGKAHGLARLQAEGIRVPDWFALSPQAFDDSLDNRQKLALERGDIEDIRSALEGLVVGPRVGAEINAALEEFSWTRGRLAVRSSAEDEDSLDRSFAGQMESYLSVTADAVLDRIVAVWLSGFAERVMAYRRRNGTPVVPKRAPAVIIQRMINADRAGVAFSTDPVSGRSGIAVISAVWGLGTALVSGEVDADTYEIDRGGNIIRVVVGTKQLSHCPNGETTSGVSARNTPPSDRRARVLTDEQVRSIAVLVRQITRKLGQAQDVEWAIENGRLFVLQTRPITTLSDRPDPDAARMIWDNSNITESYSGTTTPLTFSFVRASYEAVYRTFCRTLKVADDDIAAKEQTFQQLLGLIRGRVYYNLLNWYRVLALLPGFTVNRRFLEQSLGVKEAFRDRITNGDGNTIYARLRASCRSGRVLTALVWNYFALSRKIQRFYDRLDRVFIDPVPAIADMRIDELAAHFRDLRSQTLANWDVPVLNDFYTMVFHGTLKRLSKRWLGASELANEVMRADGQMVSVEPAALLYEMAALAAGNSQLVEVLRRGELVESLRQIRQIPSLVEKYNQYLEKFGERCVEELKLESPTLHDDPSLLLRSIGELAHANRTRPASMLGHTPRVAKQRIHSALRWHPLRRLIFYWVLRNTCELIRSRENLRFERTRVFGRVRRIFVELGKRFRAFDCLADARDIFYLQVEEILGFIWGTSVTTNLKALVALRKREFEQIHTQAVPADRFETYGPAYLGNKFQATSASQPLNTLAEERYGLGSCAGKVRGRVCVVSDPRFASLPAGSILVAERTDPGWIMLFTAAAGLVVERGSLLSHSAIVSREIGIPSVVCVPEVTRWLRDGDLVEIDGERGLVRRLQNQDSYA